MENTLKIGELQIEVLRYQFPNQNDYWDGNWLVVNACCADAERKTSLTGDPCLRTDELRAFQTALTIFETSKNKTAALEPMEPYVKLSIDRKADRLTATASIREKGASEPTVFSFPVSLSEVKELTLGLAAVVAKFPVRGTP